MAYGTGTLAVTANPAKDLMDILETLIVANGYTKVEDWTSATKTCTVYLSAAADNGGVDFYVGIYRTADTSTYVYFLLSEAYDAVNHKFQKYVPYTGVGITVNAADDTVTDAAGQLPDNANVTYRPYLSLPNPSTIPTLYWYSITHHRIIVAVRLGQSEYFIYVGQTENALNLTDFPNAGVSLYLGSCSSSSKTTGQTPFQAGGGFTREPGAPTAAASNFTGTLLSAAQGGWPSQTDMAYDSVYISGYQAVRWGVFSDRDATGLYIPRALLPIDCLKCYRLNALTLNGDSLTIGAKTYVRLGNANYAGPFVDDSV